MHGRAWSPHGYQAEHAMQPGHELWQLAPGPCTMSPKAHTLPYVPAPMSLTALGMGSQAAGLGQPSVSMRSRKPSRARAGLQHAAAAAAGCPAPAPQAAHAGAAQPRPAAQTPGLTAGYRHSKPGSPAALAPVPAAALPAAAGLRALQMSSHCCGRACWCWSAWGCLAGPGVRHVAASAWLPGPASCACNMCLGECGHAA